MHKRLNAGNRRCNMKKISRKLVMTYVCIFLTLGLQLLGSLTGTETSTAMIIIAAACGIYNISNVAQKIGSKND